MAKRTVKLASIMYRGPEQPDAPLGLLVQGITGEEVDVNDRDVDRFDALNDEYDGVEAEVPDVSTAFTEVVENDNTGGPTPTQSARPGTPGTPEAPIDVEGDEPVRPRNKALLEEWQAYAEDVGVELQNEDGTDKTKAQLIEETDALEVEEDEEEL